MAKYEQDVKALLDLIGGKENIRAVSHCMTRMRFVLADEKKADTKGIEKLASVRERLHRRASIRSSSAMMWQHSTMNSPPMREWRASARMPQNRRPRAIRM